MDLLTAGRDVIVDAIPSERAVHAGCRRGLVAPHEFWITSTAPQDDPGDRERQRTHGRRLGNSVPSGTPDAMTASPPDGDGAP